MSDRDDMVAEIQQLRSDLEKSEASCAEMLSCLYLTFKASMSSNPRDWKEAMEEVTRVISSYQSLPPKEPHA